MPVSHIMAEILQCGPLKIAEILVRLQELGFRQEEDPQILLCTVWKCLNNGPRRF
jgi:hypothetical protein